MVKPGGIFYQAGQFLAQFAGGEELSVGAVGEEPGEENVIFTQGRFGKPGRGLPCDDSISGE
ncbi:hypothetical protein GEOBRER4_n1495 [Citrifermentans bremense]|uniref:Uncharacterized protein n=1 Tax=Citrifermentans bremense TaxID=60035 RepID=A0A6S6LXA6_9BACT|nr:hypothetical protein GEOBRER4_n1495 [Citrifermentans bremense]